MIWSRIKNWALASLAAAAAILMLLLRNETKQREKAQEARDRAKRAIETSEQRRVREAAARQAQKNAREEANEHARKQKPTTERPTGRFGDSRMRDDD